MASVHISFIPLNVNDEAKKEKIVYRISHKRGNASVITDLIVQKPHHSNKQQIINLLPKNIRQIVQADIERLHSIIAELESRCGNFNASDIAVIFEQYLENYSLQKFMLRLIESMLRRGKTRTSETYRSALNSFMAYRHNKDIHIRLLTAEEIENYEAYLTRRGLVPNTISFYMRILRAVYNRAVEDQIVAQTFPFKRVYTGIDSTIKRALPLAAMKTIKELDLSKYSSQAYARDMFLLSFYLRGMSFVDMAYLKKTDLHGNTIYYRRRKTGQLLTIRWTPEMDRLIKPYRKANSPFLLPILHKESPENRSEYRNANYRINHNLKKIARKIGLQIPITLYCARHSWATVAKAEGVPLPIISEGMGHRTESTTRIYLASLDTAAVDKANHAIIRLLN